jgi:site-specific recombinase XerD/ribosomal protein L37E
LKDGFDVHDYKRRMELAVIKLKENKRVDLHNRIKIFRFLDFAETQGLSLPRRIRYLQNLTKLATMLGKTEFQKAKRTDIERILLEHGRLDLAEDTKALFRVMTKRFYRWLKDPDDEEYPPEVKWIKTTLKNNHKLLPEDLLTEQEVMELVKVAEWSRDRAFVSMLYDLGGRAGELLSLQRRNISFDDHGAVAILEGKTGQRRERLILSVPFLAAWLEEHPDKTPDAPLWIHSKQGCHEDGIVPMDYYSARRLLQRLEAKTKIEKRVNPQAFRHARATHLASILTEAQMKEYFGWTQGSRMPGRYVHLSGRDVDGTLLRAHGLQPRTEEEAPKLTVVKCVRCGLQNSTIHKLCSRCGMPLDLKTALEMKENSARESDEERRKMRDELDELKFRLRVIEDASGYRVGSLKQPTTSANVSRSEDR